MGAFGILQQDFGDIADYSVVWERFATSCVLAGRDALALEVYDRIFSSGAGSSSAVVEHAELLLKDGNLGPAQEFLRQYPDIKLQTAEDVAVYFRAFEAFDPSFALDRIPDDLLVDDTVALMRIDLLRRLGRFEIAANEIQHQIEQSPRPDRFLVRQARTLEALGQWAASQTAWEDIRKQGLAEEGECLFNLMRLLKRQDKSEQALVLFSSALQADIPIFQLARCGAVLGLPNTVRGLLDRAILTPDENEDHEKLANVSLDFGMLDHFAALVLQQETHDLGAKELLKHLARTFSIELGHRKHFGMGGSQTSPQLFLPHLAKQIPRADGEPTSDAVLLVNATLAMGGAERQLVQLVKAIKSADVHPSRIHVALFSLSEDRGHAFFLPQLRQENVHIHDLSTVQPSPLDMHDIQSLATRLLPSPLRNDALQLQTLVKQLNPGIIHGWQDRASLAAAWTGIGPPDRKLFMSVRNMQPSKRGQTVPYAFDMYKWIVQQPNVKMIANSDIGARDYEHWLGLQTGDVAVVKNALNLPKILNQRSRKPAGPVVLGGVFRLAFNKRPELWLRTFAKLQRKLDFEIEARIFGRGPLEENLSKMITDLEVTNFKIVTNTTDMAEIYAGLDALLLMSRVEGLPNVVLEAQGFGLPVAACDVGGTREACLLDGPGTALLLDEDINADTASDKIAEWLPGALAIGEADRKRFIAENFSLAKISADMQMLYGASDGHA